MQMTTGIRSILARPAIYDFFQNLMGADRVRRELVMQHIRPVEGMRLLDIGCGTARILDYLPTLTYHGFDLSQEYIDEALARYPERGTFRCAMVEEATLQNEPSYDLVLAVGVLHHLDDEAVLKLFGLAKSALKDGGRLVTIDPCFDKDQNSIARFLVSKDRGQNVHSAQQYRELGCNVFEQVTGEVKHRSWIPYTHWVMECIK
jgi:cyclopropane fatty-acyl-phospholipid synthase-like methyltransferase